MFNYPIKTCDEDTCLYNLNRVLRFFTLRGFKPNSAKANASQQWQNTLECDIQTILFNVSATLHGQDFLRADVWHHALSYWTRLHNILPHSVTKSKPASVIDPSFYVDAYRQYRFAFDDLLCFLLQDHERTWKFDVKNDIGFYVGDEDSTKGRSHLYAIHTQGTRPRGRTSHPHLRRTTPS